MKVLVLGVGKMGYGLLKDLSAQSHVDEIVAADMNLAQAKVFAERVGSEKISVLKLDATDKKETVKLMKQSFDVVAAALPRPFCDTAIDAAIDAGVGWADVAAGFSSVFSMHEKAKDAGVSVVPFLGAMGMVLRNYRHDLGQIIYGAQGRFVMVFLACILLSAVPSGVGFLLGWSSAGQRRNDKPAHSWVGFFLGGCVLTFNLILLIAFYMLRWKQPG